MSKNQLKIIGFAGRKRSGKTTLAKYLKNEENAIIITIADFLKYLCCELMNMSYEELNEKKDNGYVFDIVPDNRWFNIIDKHTHIGIDNIKKELQDIHILSIRQLLQIIGTDVIRKYNENWHVEKMVEEIQSYSGDKLIVIDDVRFPNEREAILRLSGEVFFIVRPNSLTISNHSSETALKWHNFSFDKIIINNYPNEEEFITNFKVHYKNNFETFIPKSLLVSENLNYVRPCGYFGCQEYGDISTDKDLLDDIIRQIKNDKLFWDYGLIHYKTCTKSLAKKYITSVDNNIKYLDPYCNEFITCNPLIVENLKIYL